MSKTVKTSLPYLCLLINTNSRVQRMELLKTITPLQLKAVKELMLNALLGHIHLTAKEKEILVPHRKTFEYLVETKDTRAQRKRLLLKYKGVLSLLNIILPKVQKMCT